MPLICCIFCSTTNSSIICILIDILPSDEEVNNIKNYMEMLTKRILKKHVKVFQKCEVKRIEHEYGEESAKKSEIVGSEMDYHIVLNLFLLFQSRKK